MEHVEAKQQRGVSVADGGCGFAYSTVHKESVVEDRVTVDVAAAHDFPGGDYDLVTLAEAAWSSSRTYRTKPGRTLAQNGPHSLGNHPGPYALRGIGTEAGLRNWRLAVATFTNRVYNVTR